VVFNEKEYRKEYAKKNKDKLKEYHKQWRIKNKDKIKAYSNKPGQKLKIKHIEKKIMIS